MLIFWLSLDRKILFFGWNEIYNRKSFDVIRIKIRLKKVEVDFGKWKGGETQKDEHTAGGSGWNRMLGSQKLIKTACKESDYHRPRYHLTIKSQPPILLSPRTHSPIQILHSKTINIKTKPLIPNLINSRKHLRSLIQYLWILLPVWYRD